jgi:hypothetical protein
MLDISGRSYSFVQVPNESGALVVELAGRLGANSIGSAVD